MSPENRRVNVEQEWRLAAEAWEAGVVLLRSGRPVWRAAVTRFYYCCLHAARAALLSEGLEPATHGGVRAELHRVFVVGGQLRRETARSLGDLQTLREDADYSREVTIAASDAERALADAREFAAGLGAILAERGHDLAEFYSDAL